MLSGAQTHLFPAGCPPGAGTQGGAGGTSPHGKGHRCKTSTQLACWPSPRGWTCSLVQPRYTPTTGAQCPHPTHWAVWGPALSECPQRLGRPSPELMPSAKPHLCSFPPPPPCPALRCQLPSPAEKCPQESSPTTLGPPASLPQLPTSSLAWPLHSLMTQGEASGGPKMNFSSARLWRPALPSGAPGLTSGTLGPAAGGTADGSSAFEGLGRAACICCLLQALQGTSEQVTWPQRGPLWLHSHHGRAHTEPGSSFNRLTGPLWQEADVDP